MPRAKQTYRVEYYQGADGGHRYRVRAQNGNVIVDSAEGYKRESQARRSLHNLIDAIVDGRLMEVVISRSPV